MTEQLTLTGDVAIVPRLGPAQLEVLTELREHGWLDDDEAGAIVHARRGKHTVDERCAYCIADGRHVLASLRTHGLAKQRRGDGWYDPNGPDQRAHARRTDPPTSHAAAKSVGDLRESQQAVLDCFHTHGPMHDELLQARYNQQPQQSESGLRTRRRELFDLGLLRASGDTATTVCGRRTAIWELTAQGHAQAQGTPADPVDPLDRIGF